MHSSMKSRSLKVVMMAVTVTRGMGGIVDGVGAAVSAAQAG
jgi:hypothetical protein